MWLVDVECDGVGECSLSVSCDEDTMTQHDDFNDWASARYITTTHTHSGTLLSVERV